MIFAAAGDAGAALCGLLRPSAAFCGRPTAVRRSPSTLAWVSGFIDFYLWKDKLSKS
jgi:hypothetical protein